MSNNHGLIIHFDEEERRDYLREGKDTKSFSDALSVHDWELRQLQLVLLSFSGLTIDYICLAIRGNRVATAKSRVEFSDFVDLDSTSVDAIKALLSQNTKLSFMRSSSGRGGRIPEKTWAEVLNALKELRPNQCAEIERLVSLTKIAKYRLTGKAADLLLQEREALGAALDIFSGSNQLRKEVLKAWAPSLDEVHDYDDNELIAKLSPDKDSSLSFLSGIPKKHIQEESAIQHDLYNWEDEKPNLHQMGITRFVQGTRVLEVVYANKNDLEKTLGVDLIYYNKEYHSFVLVQYKLMKKEGADEGFSFRPDVQLKKEILRMNKFIKDHGDKVAIIKHNEYRINSDGFLFKLVPNRGIQAASEKLISGMYLTREYMNYLLDDNGPKGKKGGSIITFDNSPRYLTNTEFSNLVNRGWMGSNCKQSDVLAKLIRIFQETGRALLVAVEIDSSNN
jgi:hypothetical protein